MSRGFASNYRIVLVATGLLLCFAGLGTRLVWLHVFEREQLLGMITKTRHQMIVEMARRGNIVGADGTTYATSTPEIVVAVDPLMISKADEAKLPQLAELLGLPLGEVVRICTTQYRPAPANTMVAGLAQGPSGTRAPVVAAANSLFNLKLDLTPKASTAVATEEPDEDAPAPTVQPDTIATATKSKEGVIDPNDDEETETESDGRRAIRWAKLSDHVSEATYAEIAKLNIKGLCPPERRYTRVYPHDELASQIVGFANRESKGVQGIERYAELYLHGQNGWREGERDGRNRELAQFQTRNVPRADGYTVVLTIDSLVQQIVERELDQIAKTYQPLKATIIVSRPETGKILAMANYPTYDPNKYAQEDVAHLKNLAITDTYEPGSCFKIVAASAALQEHLVTPQTMFNCGIDHIEYRGKDLGLPKEDHKFGMLSVAEILAHSSNRGAAQLAMLVGEQKYVDYVHKFGFGSKLGFTGDGEVRGTVHEPGKPGWDGKTITRMPMGQSVTATALQMHQAMCTIASGGVLMRPQVIKEIRDPNNNVVYRYTPEEISRVVSPETAHTVALLLEKVASTEGTAPEAAIKLNGTDYEVAGKTGTAQKYEWVTLPSGKRKLMPSTKHHVASFVGFFPASRPQVAISVIVDDADAHAPLGVAYGAKVAAPVFKSIGEQLIPILSITPPNQPARDNFIAAAEGGHR